jgi:hypothetical protein
MAERRNCGTAITCNSPPPISIEQGVEESNVTRPYHLINVYLKALCRRSDPVGYKAGNILNATC